MRETSNAQPATGNRQLATGYVPMARSCTVELRSGVAVGRQVAWLSIKSKGPRLHWIRVAKLTNCAVTQGPPAGGGSVHPAML